MPRGSKSRQANYETRRRAPNNSSQIELDPPKDLKPSKTTTGASRNTPAVAPKGNTHTHRGSPNEQGKEEEDNEKVKADKMIFGLKIVETFRQRL